MRYRLRTLLIVLATIAPLSTFGQNKRDPGEALYGEWEIVEMIYHATVQDFEGKPGGWFIFEKGGFLHVYGAEARDKVTLDKEPCIIGQREIDIDCSRHIGATAGLTLKALYDLKDGKLRVIWPEDYGERPTDFDALKNRRLTLYVLKKVK